MATVLWNALSLKVIINSSSNQVNPMVSEILHSHEHTSKNGTTALTFKVVTMFATLTPEVNQTALPQILYSCNRMDEKHELA